MFVNLRCNYCLSVLRCLSVCLWLFSLSPFELNSLAVLTLALFLSSQRLLGAVNAAFSLSFKVKLLLSCSHGGG